MWREGNNSEMSTRPVTSICIVGGGTAGWMTAAAMSHMLGCAHVSIKLVESDAIGTVGVGEATVPHIRFFNAKLGIDEAEFMARTKATFKLGIEFRNWGRKGDSYIHPFGAFGNQIGGVDFHHYWAQLFPVGLADSIEAYSLPVAAARSDKFAHPDAKQQSLLSTYSYAFQFDAGLYAAYLRDLAEKHGVLRHEGQIIEVEQNSDTGFVERVVLDNGKKIDADLFIDCSGFKGLLIEDVLKSGYENWSHWLPCDRAIAVPCATNGPLTPYTRATALDAGWTWRIPLQHRVGNGHVYCSHYIGDDEAAAALVAHLESPPAANLRFLRFTTGKRKVHWSKNVVAIGLAAGFLEPLESTSIHLIQLAIGRLLDFFPDKSWDPMFAGEFNRLMDLEYERVRDFLILHYHATERDDTPFWNYVRTMPIPESLALKMDAFKERGIVVNYRDGMFLDASWIAVYAGQNVIPKHVDPRVGRLGQNKILAQLQRMKAACDVAAKTLPSHSDYLTQIGANAY
jgi:tryptophan 7-halogenase